LREHCAKIVLIEKWQTDVFKLNGSVDRSHNRAIRDFYEVSMKFAGRPGCG